MTATQSATGSATRSATPPAATGAAPTLALRAVTKRFGQLVANDEVTLAVAPGEILALVGENGAGKSTVVNLICGVLQPDAGEIAIEGRAVALASPRDALARGVGVVHQHYTLVPTLTVLENIALAMPELGAGAYDRAALRRRVTAVADDLGFRIATDARIDRLDVAHQQRVEIVKALLREVRLLVLDEPTAVLGPEDRRQFFAMLDRLRARGVAIILITHKLDDVFAACDRAVVLRAGRVVEDRPTAELGRDDLVAAMIATRSADLAAELTGAAGAAGETGVAARDAADRPALGSVEGVSLRRRDGSEAVGGLSFDIRDGEILAIAGVEGNGQAELMRALAGMERPAAGTMALLGQSSDAAAWTPGALRAAGLAHIPDDRRRTGVVETLDLADNHLLCHADDGGFVSRGVIRRGRLVAATRQLIEEFDVKAGGPGDRMGALSGGNQQKAVLARELAGAPKLLLASHPTRGLDVRTTAFVHRRLRRVAEGGAAVILVSGDLDEIWQLADRILVLAAGRGFGPVARAEATTARIGAWIAGHEAA